MNIVLIGAPGAGKGTQSKFLTKNFDFDYISTGKIIRDAVSKGTSFGIQAKNLMDAGKFVEDEIVIGMVRDELAKGTKKSGYIFDGFPRNIFQAKVLSEMIYIDYAVLIDVQDQVIENRMESRRTCEACGEIYNLGWNLPKASENCIRCGGKLYIRDDDKPETVRERLKIYHETTEPIVDYYRKQGKLKIVDGSASAETINKRIRAEIGLE